MPDTEVPSDLQMTDGDATKPLAVRIAQLRPGAARDTAQEAHTAMEFLQQDVAHWRTRALIAEAWKDGMLHGQRSAAGSAETSRTFAPANRADIGAQREPFT